MSRNRYLRKPMVGDKDGKPTRMPYPETGGGFKCVIRKRGLVAPNPRPAAHIHASLAQVLLAMRGMKRTYTDQEREYALQVIEGFLSLAMLGDSGLAIAKRILEAAHATIDARESIQPHAQRGYPEERVAS